MPSLLESDASTWQLALLAAISLAVGVLGGFVGLALGTMRLPAILLLLRDMPAAVAGGTNILVSTLCAITGSYRHLRERRVDWETVAVMGGPAVAGAFIGGFFADEAPEGLLVGLAGVFVFWQGIELLVGLRRRLGRAAEGRIAVRLPFTTERAAQEAGIGFGVGLLGGAVGLILGSMRLPALLRISRMDPRIAAGTNLVIGFFLGSFGFIGHGIRGDVDLPLLLTMGASGMVGTYYGARLTGKVSLGRLTRIMGVALLVVGILLMIDAALD